MGDLSIWIDSGIYFKGFHLSTKKHLGISFNLLPKDAYSIY